MKDYFIIIEGQEIAEPISAQLIDEGIWFQCERILKDTYQITVKCEDGITLLENAGYTVYVSTLKK